MAISIPFEFNLAKNAIFNIQDPSGIQISCHSGSLWITLDGDTKDTVINSGESFITSTHRRAVVNALSCTSLSLAFPQLKKIRGFPFSLKSRRSENFVLSLTLEIT